MINLDIISCYGLSELFVKTLTPCRPPPPFQMYLKFKTMTFLLTYSDILAYLIGIGLVLDDRLDDQE